LTFPSPRKDAMADKPGGCESERHLKSKWTRQLSFAAIGPGPLTGELRTCEKHLVLRALLAEVKPSQGKSRKLDGLPCRLVSACVAFSRLRYDPFVRVHGVATVQMLKGVIFTRKSKIQRAVPFRTAWYRLISLEQRLFYPVGKKRFY
jgi:hypothetical protein